MLCTHGAGVQRRQPHAPLRTTSVSTCEDRGGDARGPQGLPEACDTTVVEVAEKVNVVLERDSSFRASCRPRARPRRATRKRVQEGLVKHYGDPVPQEARRTRRLRWASSSSRASRRTSSSCRSTSSGAQPGHRRRPGRGLAAGARGGTPDDHRLDPLSNGSKLFGALPVARARGCLISTSTSAGRRGVDDQLAITATCMARTTCPRSPFGTLQLGLFAAARRACWTTRTAPATRSRR